MPGLGKRLNELRVFASQAWDMSSHFRTLEKSLARDPDSVNKAKNWERRSPDVLPTLHVCVNPTHTLSCTHHTCVHIHNFFGANLYLFLTSGERVSSWKVFYMDEESITGARKLVPEVVVWRQSLGNKPIAISPRNDTFSVSGRPLLLPHLRQETLDLTWRH